MTAIQWDRLDPGTYEDIVSVLLSHLHPTSQRIDGSGGDGGRDVQYNDGIGLHVFELKSFTGRFTPGRKVQVKRSLMRASKLGPADWTLVVPIDPTPEELEWFEALGGRVTFRLEFKGKTWLDAQFAEREYVSRYFIEGREHEALRLLKELHEEEAALESGVPSALERLTTLAKRANELDPYYRGRAPWSGGL